MGRLPRSASPSTGKRSLLPCLLPAIVLLAAVPFAESVRLSIVTDDISEREAVRSGPGGRPKVNFALPYRAPPPPVLIPEALVR